MKIVTTSRGFQIGVFLDRYDNTCSIQKSSLATEDCIWLGIDEPKLTVFKDKDKGEYLEAEMPDNFDVNSRMHLTREQVADLLPLLFNFVATGELR